MGPKCARASELVQRGSRLLPQAPQVAELTQQLEHALDGNRIFRESVGHVLGGFFGAAIGGPGDAFDASAIAGTARDPLTTRVDEVMSPDPIRISVDRDVRSLTALLHAYHVRRIPIVDSFNEVLGIVTLDDLIGLLGDEMSEIGKAIAEEFAKHDRDE